MRTLCLLALIVLAARCGVALAQDDTGRVRALYVEATRGVLVDPRMASRPGARRWVDVELLDASSERRRTLVLVPDDIKVSVGDLVGVRLVPEQRRMASLEPLPSVSRVTRVESGSQLAGEGN